MKASLISQIPKAINEPNQTTQSAEENKSCELNVKCNARMINIGFWQWWHQAP
jgi:hypothetical protein